MADDYVLLRAVRRISGPLWAFTHNDAGEPGSAGHFYRPLWLVWHRGIFELFGTDRVAFHAGELLLYVVICLEVWLLARYFLGERPALFAALVFAAYPRHGEAVIWISGSTELLSAILGLGAILCLAAKWDPWQRAVGASVLGFVACFAKESAFVLPGLGALVLLVRGERRGLERWWPLGAMIGAQAVALAIRSSVLGGTGGGYAEYPWTPLRAAAAAVADSVAALAPPQLPVLRHPILLLVPLLVAVAVVWLFVLLWRSGDRRRLAIVLLGLAWAILTLAPTLNLAIDLNNANGERWLFMPSVGLAIALAALIEPWLRGRGAAVAAVAIAVLVVLSALNAHNWVVAGRLADRTLADATTLGPRDGELVLLTVPASYRSARVFQIGLEPAVELQGRPDLRVATCLPVQVLDEEDTRIRLAPAGAGAFRGETTWDAPFDFPVLRNSVSLGERCAYRRDEDRDWPPGLGLRGLAFPEQASGPVVLAYFDGRGLREARTQ
jgi:hypothetical protein